MDHYPGITVISTIKLCFNFQRELFFYLYNNFNLTSNSFWDGLLDGCWFLLLFQKKMLRKTRDRNGEETFKYEVVKSPMEHAEMPRMEWWEEWGKVNEARGVKYGGYPSNCPWLHVQLFVKATWMWQLVNREVEVGGVVGFIRQQGHSWPPGGFHI